MEMAATAKFGAEMLAQMSDVPAWMGAGLLKCEKCDERKPLWFVFFLRASFPDTRNASAAKRRFEELQSSQIALSCCVEGERRISISLLFLLRSFSVVVLAECKSSLRKTAAASTSGSASVAAPLGKVVLLVLFSFCLSLSWCCVVCRDAQRWKSNGSSSSTFRAMC